MSRKLDLITTSVVLGLALGLGHFVQTEVRTAELSDGRASHGLRRIEPVSGPAPSRLDVPSAPERPPLVLMQAGQDGDTPVASVIGGTAEPKPPVVAPPKAIPVSDPCQPRLTVSARPEAMLAVELSAPCDAGARVVLRHAGLAFAERLDEQGQLRLMLPALQPAGEVSVMFPGASFVHGSAAVPEVRDLRRFAIQWMADDSFALHVMEEGADYGTPGHVWTEAPVSPRGGRLVSLGDPDLDFPMKAQVYTWPKDTRAEPVIEAEVTDLTCERDLLGQTLLAEAGRVTTTDLTLSMPECSAVGDILVLNNLLSDRTLASTN